MSTYLLICIIALSVEFIVRQAASVALIKSLQQPLPEKAISHGVDPEDYKVTQNYVRHRTLFGMVGRLISFSVLVAVLCSGVLGDFDGLVRSISENLYARASLFIGGLVVIQMVLGLPMELYSTFVIEEKYGFNRSSYGTFIADQLKGLFLSAVIGLPLLCVIIFIFATLGDSGWFVVWAVLFAFTLLLQYVAPALIMPLFFKFDPLDNQELTDSITALCEKAGFGLSDVYKIDGSRRSAKANAFFTGFGSTKRIALFDTLLEGYSHKEILAVVAHELGHFSCKHTWKLTAMSAASSFFYLFCLGLFISNSSITLQFGFEEHSLYGALVCFSFLFQAVSLPIAIISSYFSRVYEFEADAFAVEMMGGSTSLVNALMKLGLDTRAHLTPHQLKVWIDYSHPPLLERVSAMEKSAAGG